MQSRDPDGMQGFKNTGSVKEHTEHKNSEIPAIRSSSKFPPERYIRTFFRVSLWFKAVFASTEIVGGMIAFFVTRQFLVQVANVITQGELREDPGDILANYLRHAVLGFSVSSRHFTAVYLLTHGVIKLWLVVGLLRIRLWYYPTALVVFSLFVVYQIYRFSYTHSLMLLFITAVDLVVIGLTWHEYRYLRRNPAALA